MSRPAERPLTYRPMLLSAGMHAVAARTPGKVAMTGGPAPRTYGELMARVRRLTGGVIRHGLRQGDRVAILAYNCIEYPELVIGLSDAGAVTATLNPRSTAHEVRVACEDCNARLLFVSPALADLVATPPAGVERVIVLGNDYEAFLATSPEAPGPIAGLEEHDPFSLVYSSGTTGHPKGIVLPHRSRVLTFHAMAMEFGCYGPDDLHLGIAPMAHGAGLAFSLATLFFGGTLHVLPKFDAGEVVELLATRPFTGTFMVPTHFQQIFALEPAFLERHRGQAKALRTIMSNAAALPMVLKEKIIAYWGEGLLFECYGSTEAGIVTSLRPQHVLSKPGSCGRAFGPTRIRLLDDDGREVKVNEVGELFSESPYLFNGYFNGPEGRGAAETAAVLRDGGVTAGDLARCDEDGFYYIVDRKKDMVVSGGINIYPREIEEVLMRHPAIAECAVVGVPDEKWGEALRAFVVLRPGQAVEGVALEEFLRPVLAAFKVPRDYRAIDALPRNVGGKVLKKDLRSAGDEGCAL